MTMRLSCEQYDAIIIGGGPAGSVTAKLLSDDRWRRVLLIEAGDASQTELGGKVGQLPSPGCKVVLQMMD
jgi:choline dehydrogenase-like flavoprotein